MKKFIIILGYIFLLILLIYFAIHMELEQNSYYINLYTIFGKNKSDLIEEEIFEERIKRGDRMQRYKKDKHYLYTKLWI